MSASRGPPRIKNKAPAALQVSAEQLLREAVERTEEKAQGPTQRYEDLEELHEFQQRRRKELEDYVRRNRLNLNNWLRYAQFELDQKDFARARSVFERCLDVHPSDVRVYLRYIDAELKTRNINHARNLLDRAVTILPRVEKLWLRYISTEEQLGNVYGARNVYQRWLQWHPDAGAYSSCIKFELRYGEVDRARSIYERLTQAHPGPAQWIKWATFEETYGTTDLVREVLSEAVETLGEDHIDERIFLKFTRFECRMKEYDRARALFKFALDRLPKTRSVKLHTEWVRFEKMFGDQEGVESVVMSKRRETYTEELEHNPKNYDQWIDLARLEETSGNVHRVRDVYERAIAQIPPKDEKRYWRRYIYIWLFYARFEEVEMKDTERAAQILQECLKIIPHKQWTFSKVFIAKAHLEIRQLNLPQARKTLGQAIGMCPKGRLFKEYIAIEKKLAEFARVRTLFEKYISWDPRNAEAFIAFAELEESLMDFERCRAIFELAINEENLNAPETVWKRYIDFETTHGEFDRARALYNRLLEKVPHYKVFISYANWEVTQADVAVDAKKNGEAEEEIISDESIERGRKIFDWANRVLRDHGSKGERNALLAAWQEFEQDYGDGATQDIVAGKMPQKVTKRRRLDDNSFEEYEDLVFPEDDEGPKKFTNLLSMAAAEVSESDEDSDAESD